MATWLIPDNFADILPREARALEKMRRVCLDLFSVHGFEQVQPPLIEFVDSLLTGSGSDLDNNTFKFMDQSSGRMIGLRADITPQIARIDAHILSRQAVSRLCYAVSCLHARPMHPLASREPIVAGAELFGASGVQADAEIMKLAVKTLRHLGVQKVHLDIGHTGILRAIMSDNLTDEKIHAVVRALRMKDPVALDKATQGFDETTRFALRCLTVNFGDASVLDVLERELPQKPEILNALAEVRELSQVCGADDVSFDFCDVHGYQYLTGITFSVHIPQYAQAILRGGRYDGVGLAFGRSRPACGFTVYLRALAATVAQQGGKLPEAVIASEAPASDYEAEVERLRDEGQTVIRLLPQDDLQAIKHDFAVTHRLVRTANGFELVALN